MASETPPAVTCLTCTCNGSIPVEAFDASQASGQAAPARALCRGDLGTFREHARQNGPLVVGCTQEAALFAEFAERLESPAELRFVNLREVAGWSPEARAAGPKIAALLAMAAAPSPAPVAGIDLVSNGSLAIIGPATAAIDWAQRLGADLDVSVLATDAAGLPVRRDFPVHEGREITVSGHLGAFDIGWKHGGPIDFERCTACGACARACPERAITHSGGIGPRHDAARCTPNGACGNACITACGELAAIDFSRLAKDTPARSEHFDLVLDLSRQPLIRSPQLPDGYLAPGADPLAQSEAARKLVTLIGEFQKPRYMIHNDARCAHHRQGKTGCSRCIDVCSTGAITSVKQRIVVSAERCAGCGGCATVCPTGAARHVYPAPSDLMAGIRRGLARYIDAGGRDACVLLHATAHGDALITLGREGKGLPARVLPVDVHDVASFGLDHALATVCYGAAQLRVLVDDALADGYREALAQQFELGNLILAALGYGSDRLALIAEAELATAVWQLPASTALPAASFVFPADKRIALDMALDHLAAHAASAPTVIPLPAKSPFGSVEVNAAACTLCLSCVGACPTGALLDTPEEPKLRFVERHCVQCGLCEQTCPEQAISLTPRLRLDAEARRPRTLHATEPFHCVACGKVYGTRLMVDAMLARLSGHSMFAGPAQQRRLQMCADCRVIDVLQNPDELSVTEKRQ